MAANPKRISYGIVILVFNEVAVLPVLLRRLDLRLIGRKMLDALCQLLEQNRMLMTGIVELYVGCIHAEPKRRPLYVVEQRNGLAPTQATPEWRTSPRDPMLRASG